MLEIIRRHPGQGITSLIKTLTSTEAQGIPVDRKSKQFFTEFLPVLVSAGLVARTVARLAVKGMDRTYNTFSPSPEGITALNTSRPIMLPVPQVLLSAEEDKKKAIASQLKSLQEEGIDLAVIPQAELQAGAGEAMAMHLQWARYLNRKRQSAATKGEADELEELLAVILAWRDKKAVALKMAPAAIMGEHIAKKVAYTRAKSESDLFAAGVRIAGINELVTELSAVYEKHKILSPMRSPSSASTAMTLIQFPVKYRAPKPWEYAILKPGRGGAPPTWKIYADRFIQGDSLQAIALNPGAGKASVKAFTVLGHVLTALIFGEEIELQRLVKEAEADSLFSIPTMEDVVRLDEAMDRLRLPYDASLLEFAAARAIAGDILGPEFAVKEPEQRTLEEAAAYSMWISKIKWYVHLRIAGVPLQGRVASSATTPSSSSAQIQACPFCNKPVSSRDELDAHIAICIADAVDVPM